MNFVHPSRRTCAHRALQAGERALAGLAIAGLLIWLGAWVHAFVYEIYDRWQLEQMLRGTPVSTVRFVAGCLAARLGINSPADQAGDRSKGAALATSSLPVDQPVLPGSPIGRLEIPSLNLSATVLEGTTEWVLNRALGHIEGTAFPGRGGNIGIAGHRDRLFRGLKNISNGDQVVLITPQGTFRYEVRGIQIVKPNDTYVLSPTSWPTLTLVTCYPFRFAGHAPQRFIVKAELVDS